MIHVTDINIKEKKIYSITAVPLAGPEKIILRALFSLRARRFPLFLPKGGKTLQNISFEYNWSCVPLTITLLFPLLAGYFAERMPCFGIIYVSKEEHVFACNSFMP